MEKKEKLTYVIGISVGVASLCLLAALIYGILYIKKYNLFIFKKEISSIENTKTDNELNSDIIVTKRLDFPEEKINGVWTRGNKNALVTITEYSDAQCPFCAKHHDTLKQILLAFPSSVKWEYKHFPLDSIHPFARKAAEAAECAGEQNDFWFFNDLVYANQKNLDANIFDRIAEKIGLNIEDFDSCLSSGKYKEKVSADLAEGKGRGVRGTPGNFINGEELRGAAPFDQIKSLIEKELNK